MTIPREEMNALIATRDWLVKQLGRRGRVNITDLRRDAARLLRHYPTTYKIRQMYQGEIGEWEAEVANGRHEPARR